mmetsp:Transcript_8956/g.17467  ORF Transcript_8956/g.17467 Transcript_8956/m.17467 type:complete len:581 (+) Transcript_8956:107-1849(+)
MIPLRIYKTRFSTLRTRVQRLALSAEIKSGVAAIRAAQQSQGCGKYEPVKFECSIAKRWAEQGSWTAEGLQRDIAGAVARLTVKRSLDRFFMYSEDGRTDLLKDDEQRQAATEVLEMGVGEFVQACASQSAHATTALPPADRPADRPAEEATTTNTNKKSSTPEAPTGQPPLSHYYHYFTSRLPHPSLCFGGARCPDSWAEYVVDEDGQERVGREQRGYPSVWLGGRGSATQAHYDVMHNSFVQLSGFKRFKLWPPTAHFALKVYPDAHPRARKARVAIPSAGEPPLAVPAVQAPFLDVVLAPGDALFVPAFWFHHVQVVESTPDQVESEDGGLSVSINVFSQARVTNQLVEHVLGNSELLSALPQGLNAESSGGHLDLNRRLNAFATLAHAFVEHALFSESDAFAPTPHGGDGGGGGGDSSVEKEVNEDDTHGGGGGGGEAREVGLRRGWERWEVLEGLDAFLQCGRDIEAAQQVLGWPTARCVEFYYCVWKYTPTYQQWKQAVKKKGIVPIPAPPTAADAIASPLSLSAASLPAPPPGSSAVMMAMTPMHAARFRGLSSSHRSRAASAQRADYSKYFD